MSGETPPGGGGTISSGEAKGESVPLLFHLQALREGDAQAEAERERRLAELDRRYEARFQAQELATKTALDAAEKAITASMEATSTAVEKAEAATERRFESVNEFRLTLSDQTSKFPSKAELNGLAAQIVDLKDRITRIESVRLGGRESRSEARDQNAAIYAAVGFVISLILAAIVIVGVLATRDVESDGGEGDGTPSAGYHALEPPTPHVAIWTDQQLTTANSRLQ